MVELKTLNDVHANQKFKTAWDAEKPDEKYDIVKTEDLRNAAKENIKILEDAVKFGVPLECIPFEKRHGDYLSEWRGHYLSIIEILKHIFNLE